MLENELFRLGFACTNVISPLIILSQNYPFILLSGSMILMKIT